MKGVGVVIARFQTPYLHKGHLRLIAEASKHDSLVILLGCNRSGPSRRNPLDFLTREGMVKEIMPKAIVCPIYDMKYDVDWSNQVDSVLCKVRPYDKDFILYGGPGSFIPHYHGEHTTKVVNTVRDESATLLREQVAGSPVSSEDFRKGVIYNQYNRFETNALTVDYALIDFKYRSILMGRKPNDPLLVFPGGFVNAGEKPVTAAVRELHEETGMIPSGGADDSELVGAYQIADWRGIREGTSFITLFYMGYYASGKAQAGDDLKEVVWIGIDDLKNKDVNPSHHILLNSLRKRMKNKTVSSVWGD